MEIIVPPPPTVPKKIRTQDGMRKNKYAETNVTVVLCFTWVV